MMPNFLHTISQRERYAMAEETCTTCHKTIADAVGCSCKDDIRVDEFEGDPGEMIEVSKGNVAELFNAIKAFSEFNLETANELKRKTHELVCAFEKFLNGEEQ